MLKKLKTLLLPLVLIILNSLMMILNFNLIKVTEYIPQLGMKELTEELLSWRRKWLTLMKNKLL
jgi:hypothetical protein